MVQIKKSCNAYVYIVTCDRCGGRWMQTECEHEREHILCPNCASNPNARVRVRRGRIYLPRETPSICDNCLSKNHCEHAKRGPSPRNRAYIEDFYLESTDYPKSCVEFLPEDLSTIRYADEDDD